MNTRITILLILALIGAPQFVYSQFVQEKAIAENEPESKYQEMQLSVMDAVSLEPKSADINIKGLNPRKLVTLENVTDTIVEIKDYRLYTVSCIKKGYMFYSEKFWPEESIVHRQEVKLAPITLGAKTDIRDITFLGDKTELYHKSKPALEELITWLNLHPDVHIAVIGHVNGPDKSMSTKFYHKASVKRSETIIAYLVEEGIDPNRLVAKGAGNKEMIYPNPVSDWQNQANRRIEIEVIALK